MEPLLEINHINYAYHSMQGETPALQNIHFTVCKGDFIAVVGPSGCGKTTLLSLIAGLLLPEEGEILLNGKRLQEQSNNPIGYMLQKDHLLEWRTIWKNIQLGLEIQGNINSASTAYANSLLKNYGLYDFKDKRPCCSRSKFLSKLLKTFDKTFREIFPVFISTKRREKPSAFFDNNFVNNAYFSEAASSSSSHLASSSSKAPISSRMTCLCLWSS